MRWCVDLISILKQIGEKSEEKIGRVYKGFVDLEKVYEKAKKEAL